MSEQDDESLEPPVLGAKYLRRVLDQFRKLDAVGIERDTAGNRKLLYSHYAGVLLLSLFNPAMQSVRGLSDASQLKKGPETSWWPAGLGRVAQRIGACV